MAIHWDVLGKSADLDLQAIIVNSQGIIVDAVYYNNLLAMNGAIGHSGDEVDKNKPAEHFSETVWVNLQKLPDSVEMIIFIVAANHGHLRDAANGVIKIYETNYGATWKWFSIETSRADVDIVASMVRSRKDRAWTLIQIEEPASVGHHFLDILEPNIGDIIRAHIPSAPSHQSVTFTMTKGAVIDLPQSDALKRLSVSMGGTAASESNPVDLDISAVLYDKQGHRIAAVHGDNPEVHGLHHSGDDKANDDGDEVITVDLMQVPDSCWQIFFVINIFTEGGTFMQVKEATCAIVDQNSKELAHLSFGGGYNEEGLVLCRLFRCSSHRWGFQALGHFCRGRSWKEVHTELQRLFHTPPHEQEAEAGSKEITLRPTIGQQVSRLKQAKSVGLPGQLDGKDFGSEKSASINNPASDRVGSKQGDASRKLQVRKASSAEVEPPPEAAAAPPKEEAAKTEDTDNVPVGDELHDEKHKQEVCNACTLSSLFGRCAA